MKKRQPTKWFIKGKKNLVTEVNVQRDKNLETEQHNSIKKP